MDVLRGEGGLEDDAVFDVGEAGGALELVEDDLAVGGEHLRPVVVRAEVGGVDEDVEGFAAGGCAGGIGRGGGGEVAGGVGRGLAEVVDGVELLVGVAGEDEVVVGEVVVALVEAEVEDDAGAGGLVGALVLEVRAAAVPPRSSRWVRTASELETTASKVWVLAGGRDQAGDFARAVVPRDR